MNRFNKIGIVIGLMVFVFIQSMWSFNAYQNVHENIINEDRISLSVQKQTFSEFIEEIMNNYTKTPDSSFAFTLMKVMIRVALFSVLIVAALIIYQIKVVTKLKKITQIREDFSNAMIHDMKTPLSTIIMTLNFLHSGRLDDKPEMKEKYYLIAEDEANHLLTLTNKILTISKLEKHKLEMQKSEIILEPMIAKLTEKFKAKSHKPVHFTVNLEASEAYADEEYLEEVLSNLIDNAIKYSKESVEIQINSESNESYTILKVRDNGLGIPKKDLNIIFNKYERATATKRTGKRGATGFGLGLNFVSQVITAHGGKIFVNSIEGEFTEFIIYLPLG